MCASERTERVADLAKGKKSSRPHGINYADVLKRKKDVLQAAMDEAALANVRESMQRALWLTIISLHDAYGFSETRLDRFFKAFRENSDELARMIKEVDSDYAYEKLRIRAEKISGFGKKIE